jgi:hypothetical protein
MLFLPAHALSFLLLWNLCWGEGVSNMLTSKEVRIFESEFFANAFLLLVGMTNFSCCDLNFSENKNQWLL